MFRSNEIDRRFVSGRGPAAVCNAYLAFAIGACLPSAIAGAPQYHARFITPGISAINAAAMNESGDVVGTGTTGSGAWVSRAGAAAVLLPLPPGAAYAFANDINDAGVIVGSVGPSSYPGLFGRAAAWFPDGAGGYTIVEYGTLPNHTASDALAVNNVGDIVGYSFSGMFRIPVLFTAPGGIQNLSSTGIFDPVDVNDQRVLVDQSYTPKRLDLDTMIVEDLGVPAGPPNFASARAEAINESGQVAGTARLAISTNCYHVAARFTDGAGWEVFSNCGASNSAYDINDRGDVVMKLNVAPYVRFENLGTFLIEDLIVADVGHWFVINGYGLTINSSRQMAVPATNDVTGEGGIVLLTPVGSAGDLDGDGDVDLADLATLLANFGATNAEPDQGDLDSDGDVDVGDLAILLAHFGV